MSDLDLNAIKARSDPATPGPWTAGGNFIHPWEVCIADDLPFLELDNTRQGRIDAKFIARARQDVPALVAAVERLTLERDQARRIAVSLEQENARQSELLESATASVVSLGGRVDTLTARCEQQERDHAETVAEVERVRELHSERPMRAYDEDGHETGEFLQSICSGCTRADLIDALDSGEFIEEYEGVNWPCATIAALDGGAS